MSIEQVAVLGVGMHPWGKWGRNFVEYGVAAARAALDDAGVDGLDLLVHRSSVPALREIPTVVLTTSSDDTDIRSVYEAGASAFITKPADLDGWLDVIAKIDDFWFKTATLPPR